MKSVASLVLHEQMLTLVLAALLHTWVTLYIDKEYMVSVP